MSGGYKDQTWCPSKINNKCSLRSTCHRVMTKAQIKESKGDLIWWLLGKPSCLHLKEPK